MPLTRQKQARPARAYGDWAAEGDRGGSCSAQHVGGAPGVGVLAVPRASTIKSQYLDT